MNRCSTAIIHITPCNLEFPIYHLRQNMGYEKEKGKREKKSESGVHRFGAIN